MDFSDLFIYISVAEESLDNNFFLKIKERNEYKLSLIIIN